ncbi:MAG: TIGR00180 family glycosyltransferase [bacterium]|nr:TIGR00180 family glycosyltransferase [bacterium]
MNNDLKVAILIPTRNRADFVIRQLRYYASVNCPHTIYIGDSSDQENSEKIKNEINKLKNKINVVYKFLPTLTRGSAEAAKHLLAIVKEKYSCYSCDDDYQIPNSLTICAEFLENNPDYATAGGYSLSFRLKNNGIYGELGSLNDSLIKETLNNIAAERLIAFLTDNYVPLFYVNRTDQLLESHDHISEIKDHIFSSEIVPSSLSIIAGKSTMLDCLGYIRQMHDQHRVQLEPSEWITSPDWNESYKIYENVISESISKKDNIPLEDAIKVARRAFTGQLLKWLSAEHRNYNNKNSIPKRDYKNIVKSIRSKIVKTFPFLKHVYRAQVRPRLTNKKELHYEVLRPESKYYKDFKPIMDSFSGVIKKSH